jgi:(1->4)-alpha-D-glucan 1-alpha-D-glucosylmutase
VPIYVEKILGIDEKPCLMTGRSMAPPAMNSWTRCRCSNTPEGEQPLAQPYGLSTASAPPTSSRSLLARQQILNGSLAGDFESVAQALLKWPATT